MESIFSLKNIEIRLQGCIQKFLSEFSLTENNQDIISLCIYFDDVNISVCISLYTKKDYLKGIDVGDVPAWTFYDICNLHYDEDLRDDFEALSAFINSFYDSIQSNKVRSSLRVDLVLTRFRHIIYNIVENLSYTGLNRTDDFFTWACDLYGVHDSLYETVPNWILEKYFPGFIERLDKVK